MVRFALSVVLFCVILSASAETLQGRVVGVADGDTVTVLDAALRTHKIRIGGIDAPEKRQAYGRVAHDYLAQAVFNKQVTVEFGKSDRYGRIVGKVWVDERDVGLDLIRTGLAWHYKKYEREQPFADRASYARAERLAIDERRGLWQEQHPTPPWDFRARPRS